MAEKAKKKSSKKKKVEFLAIIAKVVGSLGFRIVFYAALIMLLYYGATRAYQFGYRIFDGEPVEAAPGTDVVVVIGGDMSDSEITSLLQKKGLIKDTTVFRILLRLYTNSKYGIIEGEYTLNTSMSARDMIKVMSGSISPETTPAEEHLGLYDTDAETWPDDTVQEGSGADGS